MLGIDLEWNMWYGGLEIDSGRFWTGFMAIKSSAILLYFATGLYLPYLLYSQYLVDLLYLVFVLYLLYNVHEIAVWGSAFTQQAQVFPGYLTQTEAQEQGPANLN